MIVWWVGSVVSFIVLVELLRKKFGKKNRIIPSYQGFRVVITGASSGIGKELALQYAQKGCRLLLAARRTNLLEEVREECLRRGSPEVLLQSTDVTKVDQCRALINVAAEHWDGEIDLLVLNAGRSCIVEFANVGIEAISEITELNVYGCFYPSYFALPLLRKARGTILAISSQAGVAWSPLRTIYS